MADIRDKEIGSINFRIETNDRELQEETDGQKAQVEPMYACVMVRFDDEEHARFMERYKESSVYAKAVFCKAMVFGESFRVLKENEMMLPYNEKLRDYHAKFRTLSTIYNLIVKEMHVNFSECRTIALMQRLEKATKEMTALAKDVISLACTTKRINLTSDDYV